MDAPGGNDHLMCPTLRPETFPDGRALLLLSATEAEVQRFVGTCSTYIRDPTGCSRILPLKIKLGASSFKDPVLAGMISSVRPRGALTTLIATDMFNLEPTKLDLHKHGPFLSCGPDYTNPVCHMPLARVSIRLSHGIVERDGTQEMRELDPPTNVMGHLSGTWTLGDSALQAIKTYVQNSPASSIGGQPDLVLRLDSDSVSISKMMTSEE